MSLEQVAATSFISELAKIAASDSNEKTAAAMLLDQLGQENVTAFLKEAGFGAMLGGIGRGVGALGMGALRGAGNVASGALKGVGGAISNTAANAAGALKAAPGALGQKMTALGQRAEQGLSGMGQRLQAAGQARGQAIQGRLAGPAKPVATPAPTAPVASSANVQSGLYKPPMLSARQQLAEANPFHGMVGSLAENVRGVVGSLRRAPAPQPPPQVAPQGTTYGSLAPAM